MNNRWLLRLITIGACFMSSLLFAETPSHIHIFSSGNVMGYVKPCG
ncbi:hypothetical protein JW960_28110 [candidate division KSB1 bacterium]|nr:hypothetical protein [candidate division KSB1 bacterium]